MGDEYNNNVDIASKYQVELNNKYSTFTKQGSSNGEITKEKLIQAVQQQLNTKKRK